MTKGGLGTVMMAAELLLLLQPSALPASAHSLSALLLHHICRFGAFLADAVLRFVLIVQEKKGNRGLGA